jgi:DNA-binding response OmpR family regulator
MKMRERIPDFPIVEISGMTTLDFVNDTPELSNVVSLQKPFRPADLVLAVEAATRRRSSGAGDAEIIAGTIP